MTSHTPSIDAPRVAGLARVAASLPVAAITLAAALVYTWQAWRHGSPWLLQRRARVHLALARDRRARRSLAAGAGVLGRRRLSLGDRTLLVDRRHAAGVRGDPGLRRDRDVAGGAAGLRARPGGRVAAVGARRGRGRGRDPGLRLRAHDRPGDPRLPGRHTRALADRESAWPSGTRLVDRCGGRRQPRSPALVRDQLHRRPRHLRIRGGDRRRAIRARDGVALALVGYGWVAAFAAIGLVLVAVQPRGGKRSSRVGCRPTVPGEMVELGLWAVGALATGLKVVPFVLGLALVFPTLVLEWTRALGLVPGRPAGRPRVADRLRGREGDLHRGASSSSHGSWSGT